ncbi:arad-like aldolase/epimerase [Cadophora sp. DSE1049]|nr:arad-like aldolase/epimerase [Cadophora sp. DSE1049]
MSASTATVVINTTPQTQTPTASNLPTALSDAAQPESSDILSIGGYMLPDIPAFTNIESHRQWIREHMAAAFRAMGRAGLSEGVAGHISVRDPENSETFWIYPLGVHFGMTKASDMVLVDALGGVVGENKAAVNAAVFQIHSAIHRLRPDVHAACHAHGVNGRAWAVFGQPLDIIIQDSCTLYKAHSVYSNFGGTVFEGEEAQRLAYSVAGDTKAVILQNHGLLTVGSTVDEAMYLFMAMENLCEIQLKVEAACAGERGLKKILVTGKAAAYSHQMGSDPVTLYQEFQLYFKYEMWKSKGEISN